MSETYWTEANFPTLFAPPLEALVRHMRRADRSDDLFADIAWRVRPDDAAADAPAGALVRFVAECRDGAWLFARMETAGPDDIHFEAPTTVAGFTPWPITDAMIADWYAFVEAFAAHLPAATP